jgi:hypothetical protein
MEHFSQEQLLGALSRLVKRRSLTIIADLQFITSPAKKGIV